MVGLGGLELPYSPLSGPRSSHLSYRPQHRRGTFTTISLYGGLAYFAIVRNLRFGTRLQLLRSTYCARSRNQSSAYSGGFRSRSVKMYWLSQEVQCFGVHPINKQNHNAGPSKINT